MMLNESKKLNKLFITLLFIGGFFVFKHEAHAANRYWVGGCTDATWSCSSAGTTNWGSASNTRDNASVPGTSDDVFFDGVGFGASDSTNSGFPNVKSLDFTGYSNILTINTNTTITISGTNGNLTMSPTMSFSLGSSGSGFSLNATSGTSTITTNGLAMPSITFNGVGGTFVMADAITPAAGASRTITLTNGTLKVDGPNDNSGLSHTWSAFSSSNSNTRTLNLGNASININLTTGGTGWNIGTPTNLTINPGTSVITMSGATITFNHGNGVSASNATYYGVAFTGSGTRNLFVPTTGATITNLTLTGTAVKTGIFTVSGPVTVSGTLNLTGDSSTNRVLVTSNTLGTARTITANGTVSISNIDFRDITGAGSANWDLSAATGGSGDALGNTGITFTPAQTNYWVGDGGSWSDSTHWASSSGGTGGTGRVPLPQDDVRFDSNSFSSTGQDVNADMPRQGKDVDWTGATNGPRWRNNLSATNNTVYGSITMSSNGMSLGGGAIIMECRTTCSLDMAGQTYSGILQVSTFGGTMNLASSLIGASTLVPNFGTFNANNYNITVGAVQLNASVGPKTVNMGSGTWTVTGSGNAWVATSFSGITINPQDSTILISNTTSSSKTFINSTGASYNNVTISGGGAGSVTFSSAVTINKLTVGAPKTVTFTSATTNRLNRLVATGSSGNTITLNASTPGSVATLSMPGANTFVGDYLAITDLNATGGAKWYAGANSTLSNSTGWLLQAGPQRRGSFIQDAKVRLEKGKMIINAR